MRRMIMTFIAAAMVVAHVAVVRADAVRFGVLPVMQALPLFVAQERGLFTQEGVNVEIIPFKSGLEKDAAMAAGQIQGYFGDMFTSLIMGANQVPMRMVATLYNTTGDQRMFAILAAPGSGKPTLAQVAEKGIAGSSNTVIEYVIVNLLQEEAPGAALNLVESRNILARMPMLLEGQVAAAALPEPLVTLVEKKGAAVVADDRGKGLAPTVLMFSLNFIHRNGDDVRKFLKAVARASAMINADPESARPVMIKYARIPEPLRASIAIPVFPELAAPDRQQAMDAYNFLAGKKVLKRELAFSDMVREDLLP